MDTSAAGTDTSGFASVTDVTGNGGTAGTLGNIGNIGGTVTNNVASPAGSTLPFAAGTVTNEALDTTETGVDVTNGDPGHYFTHVDGDFDIVIGGERMTVTAVSGTGTSQTLTVARSVNGVTKTHAAGADVELFIPARYGL